MQAWPLERKIQVTQAKIIEWYRHYGGKVSVSFSGGKDSVVAMDLARRAYPDIPAVFVDTGLEYPEIREFVKSVPNVTWLRPERSFTKVIERYGFPVISKDVAKRIYYARKGGEWAIRHMNGFNSDGSPSWFCQRYMKWRFLLEAPFPISDHCCEVMKKRPFHKYVKETGNMPILGTMACESKRREGAYLKTGCNAFEKNPPSSQPMSFWTEQDVLQYLRMTGIPYAPIYGDIVERNGKLVTTGAHRTGCMFCMFGLHLEKKPTSTKTLSASRVYPCLSDADLEFIPKTITDGGNTLTLADVQWANDGTYFTATAKYTGTTTSRYATGYTVTADYTGEIAKPNCEIATYTAIFGSTKLEEPEPEPTPTPEPTPEPTFEPTPTPEPEQPADEKDSGTAPRGEPLNGKPFSGCWRI